MSTNVIDTLKFANRLIKAGQTKEIAEAESVAIAEIFKEMTEKQLVTKSDMRESLNGLEMRLYTFMVKVAVFTVTILAGIQTLLHFT